MADEATATTRAVNDEVRDIWNANAEFWDNRMREGNDFHRLLVGPSTERLLDLKSGEVVLEIACGNGQLARRMAEIGAIVLATDFSERFLEQARERTEARPDLAGRIDYRVLDATDEAALLALGLERFDAAVCSMGVMDMVEIRPMLRAARQLLRPGGRFVITLMHPCFNHSGIRLSLEEEDIEGEIVETRSVKVLRYLSFRPTKGLGMIGQPKAQYYFHRPLIELFGSFFDAGFVIDGIEEPAFRPEDSTPNRALGWDTFTEIPPVMSIRLRPKRWGVP